MPNYRPYKNTGQSIPGWPSGQTRYFSYPASKTCAEGEDLFRKLSPAEAVLATKDVIPDPDLSTHWVARSCQTGADIITDVVSTDPNDTASGGSGGSSSTPAGLGQLIAQGTATYNGQTVSYITLEIPDPS